jgi:hypothetical protein
MAALFFMLLFGLEPAPAGIEGIYHVKGKEPNGDEYTAVSVVEKKGEVYQVSWMIGPAHFVGIGVRTGDSLSVAWAVPKEGFILRGVNVYRIGGKTLTGTWATMPGGGTVGRETMTLIKGLE